MEYVVKFMDPHTGKTRSRSTRRPLQRRSPWAASGYRAEVAEQAEWECMVVAVYPRDP